MWDRIYFCTTPTTLCTLWARGWEDVCWTLPKESTSELVSVQSISCSASVWLCRSADFSPTTQDKDLCLKHSLIWCFLKYSTVQYSKSVCNYELKFSDLYVAEFWMKFEINGLIIMIQLWLLEQRLFQLKFEGYQCGRMGIVSITMLFKLRGLN